MSASRETTNPRTIDKSSKEAPWNFNGAPRGTIRNAPHDSLPNGSLAGLKNAHAFPTEIQSRPASRLWDSTPPPALEGRTGYTASQEGDVITSLSGDIFTEDEPFEAYWNEFKL